MSQRRDLLGECNTERLPLNEFNEGWCRRCVNPECSRSLFGQSRFDLRVNSWEDRLFLNPPRMDPSDPRYDLVSKQKFLSIDTSAPPEIRSWVDPMAQPMHEPTPHFIEPKVKPAPPALKSEPPPVVSEEPSVPSQALAPRPQVSSPTIRPEVLSMNAPNQGGKMLSGVRNPQPVPPRDPWAAPEPAENVIPVGGRVKLKGSGV